MLKEATWKECEEYEEISDCVIAYWICGIYDMGQWRKTGTKRKQCTADWKEYSALFKWLII